MTPEQLALARLGLAESRSLVRHPPGIAPANDRRPLTPDELLDARARRIVDRVFGAIP